MKSTPGYEQLLGHIRQAGSLLGEVTAESTLGRHRFEIYAVGDDRFVLQRNLGEARRLMALIRRADLRVGRRGMVLAVCSGNFGTVLTPLFSGALGKELCRVPRTERSSTLAKRVVLGRVTPTSIDLLQRDTDFDCLIQADGWLQAQGLGLNEISFCERTPEALAYAEPLGQVWRIKPRVYALEEMRRLVEQACQPMETEARYFVSLRGVHWLTYAEFERLAQLARTEPEAVAACLREWVVPPSGERVSAMRRAKGALGSFAISFFGIGRETVEQLILPPLERLAAAVAAGEANGDDLCDTLHALGRLYLHSLQDPAFASLEAEATILALYARICDDDLRQEERMDFDARRVALPGVTIRDGREIVHPGADWQTLTVVDHLKRRLSFDEHMEFINVYEVRSSKLLAAGTGQSREIVMKTDRSPVPISYIQKRLGSVRAGYANYLLTRVNVFRALGADYPAFELLTVASSGQARRETPYFLRTRCPGDPLAAIPPELFRADPDNPHGSELPEVVLALARLYGSSAAQNLVAKKFVPEPKPTCRFGIGKEIFAFVYDPFMHRPMPEGVQSCSIRGTMGWPNLAQDAANLYEAHRFYLRAYALALGDYWHSHAETCTLNDCASAFFDGFERRVEAMYWTYRQNKASFDSFNPRLHPRYTFRAKLDFALWALERAALDLPALREHFMDYVRDAMIRV